MRWKELESVPRLLIETELEPVQGVRFQPTGFPDIGPAEYRAPNDTEMLLVESAQSMANHLERVCWDDAREDLSAPLAGLPYVKSVLSDGGTTNSILEAHRLNSPYIMRRKGDEIDEEWLRSTFPELAEVQKSKSERALAHAVFRYDTNSVIHGIFLEKIGGGLRLRRLLSAFIEASDVRPADSGGIKADRVDPTGKRGGGAEAGYGHVPFHRREFAAGSLMAYFNLDLAQLRAYGLGTSAEDLLVALALYKVQRLLSEPLRLRTACDLRSKRIEVTEPKGWTLPGLKELEDSLPRLIKACSGAIAVPPVTQVNWTAPPKKTKQKGETVKDEPEAEGDAE